MRIFVAGNTPGGIAWVIRLLEELTGLETVLCDVGLDYDNSTELDFDEFKDYEDGFIYDASSASYSNLKGLGETPNNDEKEDYRVTVGRNIEDCICEVVVAEGREGMTFAESLNYTMEKNPHSLIGFCRDWMELGVKIHNEYTVNIEYVDLCHDLKKVLTDLVKCFGLKIKRNKILHILDFCSVGAFTSPTVMNKCGKSLLDENTLLKIENIKRQLRRK